MTLIDLSYADPPAPSDLAERARHQGGRIRRRRSARRAGGAALLVATLAVGATHVMHPGPTTPFAPSGAVLPTGTPVTTAASTPAATVDDIPMIPAGPVVDLGLHTSAGDLVAFATRSGYQCLSERTASGLAPIECRKLIELDTDGLWGNSAMAPAVSVVADPRQHAGRPTQMLVFGLARGRVDRVMISLPSGTVAASLASIGSPSVGSFYWAVTDDFDELGAVLDPALAATYPGKIGDIPRVGFAGPQVIQSCVGNVCT